MVRHCTTAVLVALLLGCSTTPVQPVSGEQTFLTHCAACHGAEGRGDGPVAATLSVPVPDLRTLTRRYGEFPADRVASYIDGRSLPAAHGTRSMPVWGGVFDTTDRLLRGAADAEHRIEAVVAYLRERQEAPN
jgi:mono/diheme cytochrome c family protein